MLTPRARFTAAAATRILLTDGAFGTAIQTLGLAEADYAGELGLTADQKGNNDLLALTRPDVVEAITRDYLAAGSDIVSTNTFSANRISQADYAAEALVGDINRASAAIARRCVDEAEAADGRPRFVAGAIGPTNKTLSLSPDVNDPGYREITFDELTDVYAEQAEALADGGADFILIETVFDTLNAKAGVAAVKRVERERGHRPAHHDEHDADRPVRPQPVRPHGGSVLVRRAPRAPAHHRAELFVRGGAVAAACRRAVPSRRRARHGLSQCQPAQRAGRV